ncbi:glycoside hydrolase family 38 C-terminal domain-containing protein [Bacillus sp. FSL K6-3431]|uniref:glycoside hydrolase family 38 C-terminal domain-containing protein n=1 Tax=Bacillus sp. FSL K6-3431 TaxID=2921500 RepID=UPI0030F71A17
MTELKKAYFVDGYHGGIKGHMPLGSWTDVIKTMKNYPKWKISLDIEPISWDELRKTDPDSYLIMKNHLKDNGIHSRVEMLAGSYAQPFGWVIGGESNIRHLLMGREVIQDHFPEVVVDTYATQEPCWSSCFPQILHSLGYTRAVLKNPGTGWAGYASGIEHETVMWVGPDGSSIPCVPRYDCEELLNCWETEAGYMDKEFVEKCVINSITHPVGSFLQDLGWPAHPKLGNMDIQYVTWREYFESIAEKTTYEWYFTQEDIRCTLPWGEGTLQQMARQVRSAENKILITEKIAALASASRGFAYPREQFRKAWDQLLLSQHHDAWICATTGEGRDKWAWQAGTQSWNAEAICNEILDQATDSFRSVSDDETTEKGILVFNTLASNRIDIVEIELPTPEGTTAIRVTDLYGHEVKSQIIPTRTYDNGKSVNACKLLFKANIPSFSYSTYSVQPIHKKQEVTSSPIIQMEENTLRMITDIYEITLDTSRGGVITRLFEKTMNKDFVRGLDASINEYTGYFIQQQRWISSTDSVVSVDIKENGPLRAHVQLKGKMDDTDFTTEITVTKGEKRIDFHVRFHYKDETWIGDPWDIEPENRRTERRKSHHNDKYKLKALFPVSLENRKLYKNAAFDVVESRHVSTSFTRWDEIKHSVLLNWVDVYDEQQNCGLALFTDHTTGYSHSKDEPLALTLGWGWEGGFWWGKRPLVGQKELNYSILPHANCWNNAEVQLEYVRWAEPLLPIYTMLKPGLVNYSFLSISDSSIEIPTILQEGEDLLVRLFNSGSDARHTILSINAKVTKAEIVELDGKYKERLLLQKANEGGYQVEVSLNGFGIKTVRFCNVYPKIV